MLLLIFLVFVNIKSEKSFNSNDLQIEKLDSMNLTTSFKNVIWYKIITPVKNETKGYLFLKTEDGNFDTTRISTLQTSVFTSLLNEKNIQYNTDTKSLILTSTISNQDTLTLNR
jgi:hypothetical protein